MTFVYFFTFSLVCASIRESIQLLYNMHSQRKQTLFILLLLRMIQPWHYAYVTRGIDVMRESVVEIKL